MTVIKFLLDEDVAKYLGTAMDRVDPRIIVKRVVDVEELGAASKDPALLQWAEMNGFAVVTNDRGTMPAHATDHVKAGNHTWGVFVIRKGFSARDITDWLVLMHEASHAEEWRDQVRYIPF
ncbi:MAG: DUF5615 family PIN-like protein [Planctomycetes bacterium]|nr:DUF5615 family PIN-like protein [Planctomycetota bacterium]